MKKKILISGLGGSLFPYLHNALKDNYDLLYIDSNQHLSKIYPDLNFYKGPLVLESSYIDFVKNIINKQEVDIYIPLIDEEVVLAKSEIEGFKDVIVISPEVKFSERSLDKYRLMKDLENFGISKITSFMGHDFNWQLEAPIFVKPVTGRGSRGIKTIYNQKQLEAYYMLEGYAPEEILVQPKLEGIEYTIGVTVNNKNQVLAIGAKRVIEKKGITQMAITENVPEINEIAIRVVEELKPYGPINIQLIKDQNKELRIFEINPRFSTTTIMEFEGGLNLITMYLENYNKNKISEIKYPIEGITLYRRWESIFYV